MLSKENNLLLCSVGPGTPAGQLFRSMWLPAMLSSQLPDRVGTPVRLKLLGEELVAFRDGEGKVGIVQSQCAHRLAPLFLGRVEPQGIRCPYHGWLYDSTGQCLEIPSEPSGTVCRNMKIKAYQTTEKADIVWVYMGEGAPPALPQFPWIDLPKDQRMASVWLQESNWFQGVEGEVDSSHVSILHKSKSQKDVATMVHQKYTFLDPTPKLFTHDTPVGFLSIARRRADERFYWRLTQWMLPMFSLVPSAVWPIGGRAWIPIDDENTYTWDFSYSLDQPIPPAFLHTVLDGMLFPPAADYGRIRLNTGSVIETWIPRRRADNDYLIDRRQQAEDWEVTGIYGINDQDRSVQEGMGRISDRPRERLVAADLTVVTARRKVLEAIKSPESIAQFRRLIEDGSVYACNPVDTVLDTDDLQVFLQQVGIQ
ncbi:Rieske 2Fe-2S domain-containing protein [Ramlibacter tataouinensis]|uniref:Rieske 2Fe-2S domain-containing protein n=1 Tax=Ramlibacter tataouinensis TaxID=94132 RepID=UPI0022F3BEF1|nr:Rieske 2Fe-2S domain-containing protein [Ramlibacter tataouinensis]WBY02386.1 Rieske 2Fe-2S domain-containing protein [Ramlibacter tataouinensis]